MKSRFQGLLLLILCSTSALAKVDVEATKKLYQSHGVVEIEIKSKNWDTLRAQSPKGGNCKFNAPTDHYDWFSFEDVKVNGISFKNVGARKRSFCGSFSTSKPAFALSFDKYLKANEVLAESKLGTTHMALNNSLQDVSYVRQCASYRLFRKAGVRAPLCNFAHVTVNGQDMGIYVNVQPYKKAFFKQNSAKDEALGNLYEVEGQDFQYGHVAQYAVQLVSFKKTEDKSLADIKKVIYTLSTESGMANNIKKYINVDQFTRFWAAEIILAHWDGLNGNRNNSYLYFPEGGKMQVLPWGTDQVLARNDGLYLNSRLAKKMWAIPEFSTGLRNRVNQLLASIWDEEEINQDIQASADAIYGHLSNTEQAAFGQNIDALKTRVNLRKAELKNRF